MSAVQTENIGDLKGMVVLLAVASAIGQFSTSIYTPSIPALMNALASPESLVQLTITAYLAALAGFQLGFGPLSDHWGRKPTLQFGFAIFIVGSATCYFANSIEMVVIGRVFQGIGACAGMVVTRAMSRDLFSGPALVKASSVMSLVFALAPGFSPLLGGLIQESWGWRATFAVSGFFALAVMIWTWVGCQETLREGPRNFSVRAIMSSYRPIATAPLFLGYAIVTLCVLAGIMAFVAGAPRFMIVEHGLTPAEFGLYPATAIIGFFLGTAVAGRWATRMAAETMVRRAMIVLVAIGPIPLILYSAESLKPITLNICMTVYLAGMGAILPTAVAAAMQPYAKEAGAASALMGFLQMMGGVAGTLFVAQLVDDLGTYAFTAALAVFPVTAFLFFTSLQARAGSVASSGTRG
ncbi:MAG: multidrug effflux MFS transporter [Pseudomonadota bacterium]